MKSWSALCAPPTGNQPVAAANHNASSDSNTSGTDKPTKANSEQPRSTHESFLTAAQMPSGMAMPQAMMSAKNESRNVFQSRPTMSDVAGIL